MIVKDVKQFRKYFKALRAGRNNPHHDPNFIGDQHEDITGFLGMFHGHKPKPLEFLRTTIAMAEDDQGIYEFVQNAADAGSTHFYMFYDEDNFLVLNNGKRFEKTDIISILNVGQSEGKEDCDKIGKFGIGFKLVHRLVGRNTGLNEIFEEFKGPHLFSWNKPEHLIEFRRASKIEMKNEENLPWYFKVLITNFPVGVDEEVKDINYKLCSPFTNSEFKEFQTFLNSVSDQIGLDEFSEGSAFYLKLGEGKYANLKSDSSRLNSEVSHTLHFLKEIKLIQINDQKLIKDKKYFIEEPIIIKSGTDRHNQIGLEEERDKRCPVIIQYGFYTLESILEDNDLRSKAIKSVNYYKYFPIGEEKSGFSFIIHCNVFDIGSQRRNLHNKSSINIAIFKIISEEWIKKMEEYKSSNKNLFYSYFAQVLISTPIESNDWQIESLYVPLLDYIKSNTPTNTGEFKYFKIVKIKNCDIEIPINDILGKYWYNWNSGNNNPLISAAKNNAKLGLNQMGLLDVISESLKKNKEKLENWIADLEEAQYLEFLEELTKDLNGIAFILHKVSNSTVLAQRNEWKRRRGFGFIRTISKNKKLVHLSVNDIEISPKKYTHFIEWTKKYGCEKLIPTEKIEWLLISKCNLKDIKIANSLLNVLTNLDKRREIYLTLPEIIIEFDEDIKPKEEGQQFKTMIDLFDGWDVVNRNKIREKIVLKQGENSLGLSKANHIKSISIKNRYDNKVKINLNDLIKDDDSVIGVKLLNGLKNYLHEIFTDEISIDIIDNQILSSTGADVSKRLWKNIYDQMNKETNGLISNCSQFAFIILLTDKELEFGSLADWKLNDKSLDSVWYLTDMTYINESYILPSDYLNLPKLLKIKKFVPYKQDNFILADNPGQIIENEIILSGIKDNLESNEFLLAIDMLFQIWSNEKTRSIITSLKKEDIKYLDFKEKMVFADESLRIKEENPSERSIKWLDSDIKHEFINELGYLSLHNPLIKIRQALIDSSIEFKEEDFPENCEYQNFEDIIIWLCSKGNVPELIKTEQQISLLKIVCKEAQEDIFTKITDEIIQNSKEWDEPEFMKLSEKKNIKWEILLYPGKLIIEHSLSDNLLDEEIDLFTSTNDIYCDLENKLVYLNDNDILTNLFNGAKNEVENFPFDNNFLIRLFTSINNKKRNDDSSDSKKEQLEGKNNRLKRTVLKQSQIEEFTFKWLKDQLEWEYCQNLIQLKNNSYIKFKRVEVFGNNIVLGLPTVDELPSELIYYNENSDNIKLELGSKGHKYKEVSGFEILNVAELEVIITLEKSDFEIDINTIARIGLPKENFLLRNLFESWNDYIEENDENEYLVKTIQESLDEDKLGFIFGPPGTGKTTTLAKKLIDSFINDPNNPHILVLTPTNNASDVLYHKLIELVGKTGKEKILRFGPSRKRFNFQKNESCIIITTVHRYCFDKFDGIDMIKNHQWSQIAFDEASMMPLPYILLPIVEHSKRLNEFEGLNEGLPYSVTVVGDPFQLMPVGLTPSLGDLIENSNIRGFSTDNVYTLFEFDSFEFDTTSHLDKDYRIERLTKNYRNPKSIVKLFGNFKYTDSSGNLLVEPTKDDLTNITLDQSILKPVNIWTYNCDLPVKNKENDLNAIYRYHHAAYHVYSAVLATKTAIQIINENKEVTISIITPYSKQTKICEELLHMTNNRLFHLGMPKIKVSTIHRFQGDETDITIFILNPASSEKRRKNMIGGLICGGISHFNNHNLLNVAISRPKKSLICIIPESNLIDRTGYSEYVFYDTILSSLTETSNHVDKSENIEKDILRERIKDCVHIEKLRSFDVYRNNIDSDNHIEELVSLVGDKNLTLIIQKDLIMKLNIKEE